MISETLKIALAQVDIAWEKPLKNLEVIHAKSLEAARQQADLIVFPEVMTTGFSMDVKRVAEPLPSPSIGRIQEIAKETNVAIVSSILVADGDKFYNRAYIITPDGETFFQDKRHLFRMGGESKSVSPARERSIFTYRGWRILLIACYDLRFPVWCRNKANEYDLLIDVANWPEARRVVWSTLLKARAMENIAYVCGVNRVGVDPENFVYTGDSVLIDSRGKEMAICPPKEETLRVVAIEKAPLERMREKFPAWLDIDPFVLDLESPYPIY
ncbi:nitrilase family protein [Porphyromonas circumdentaria]|uniref:Omega-amidase YafV n=1 Tax=Porphyromonas circumdentaria TaxID=29524 RepID=A0A1T4KRS9_9PORP|nr:nitrilase family protein [Porphyromonas circumdentaria]MBB6274931.1 putative amidohydrolase [Porphyromonas circumdentaria]MDO4722236.1 nitrilase family protein [Porphyromonas circumdentaria]SJZ45037.1 Carbon-nitrogen hydrolase [Porphyromonas circumdentaria]